MAKAKSNAASPRSSFTIPHICRDLRLAHGRDSYAILNKQLILYAKATIAEMKVKNFQMSQVRCRLRVPRPKHLYYRDSILLRPTTYLVGS